MKSPRDIAIQIINLEGGFVNDPLDSGGATKFGVTLETAKRYNLDVNKDGKVDIKDIRKLKKSDAVNLFLQEYYFAPKINRLCQNTTNGLKLRTTVFDASVNMGQIGAIKLLQSTINLVDNLCIVDGIIGPNTERACDELGSRDINAFTAAFSIERANFYLKLADKRPKDIKFIKGWLKRARKFIPDKYKYLDKDIQARFNHLVEVHNA